MQSLLRVDSADLVKSEIARLVLENTSRVFARLGRIELHSHQRSAIQQISAAIEEFGGAILCDPVGTGKTFTALAVSAGSSSPVVVGPAVLRDMWKDACRLCERAADYVSFESLSRGGISERDYDFVIIDEAHHARNPATRRFRFLSRLVANTPLLLLTATPIHNRRRDLTALASLFYGERAKCLSSSELARVVVRRDELVKSIPGIPRLESMERLRAPENCRIPELLLSLPPPLPVRDGSDGGALIAHSLIREWASSDAALIGGLQRRLIRAESLSAALADGTWPSRAELTSWIAGENDVQLGFTGLLAPAVSNTEEMLEVVRVHMDALRAVLKAARGSQSDADRADLIREVRRTHCDRRIVAFSQYAETINGYFRILSHDGKVAALTGSGARVAGGAISRSDAIAAFAPRAQRRRPPRTSDEITLLLTTDLLSEGVNLQDAGVVIHLDLPWTPARMEQRVGRIARAGSLHDRVQSYAILPPISAEDAIRIEGILRNKVEQSSLVVRDWPSLTGLDPADASGASAPQINEAARSILSRWMKLERRFSEPTAAGVRAAADGFLAAVRHHGLTRVVAKHGGRIGNDTGLILDCLESVSSTEATISESQLLQRQSEVIAWVESNHALPSSYESPIRNRAAGKIRQIVAESRAYRRTQVAQKAEEAMRIISGRLGAFEESVIEAALHSFAGEEFLEEILAIRRSSDVTAAAAPKVLAMLILVSE